MSDFYYGVIEGFYGRPWSWDAREAYASFLTKFGFGAYIYAPKSDLFLRGKWRESHPQSQWDCLCRLAQVYRQSPLSFGVGLSPVGLNYTYNAQDKIQLKAKVTRLNSLNADILCILFDDTQGGIVDLAQRQMAIVEDVMAASSAKKFIVCPSYYSFDPVLEELFGEMPQNYLQQLVRSLPREVDVFWTGNRVISETFADEDIARISEIFARKPLLWDNYPVNDGKLSSNFINLRSYTGRPWYLKQTTAGHIVNPMNQPLLSEIVLQSLQSLYQLEDGYDAKIAFNKGIDMLDDSQLASSLRRDVALLQDRGLVDLSASEKLALLQCYKNINHRVASEICDWLSGGYKFDPNCLTDSAMD